MNNKQGAIVIDDMVWLEPKSCKSYNKAIIVNLEPMRDFLKQECQEDKPFEEVMEHIKEYHRVRLSYFIKELREIFNI